MPKSLIMDHKMMSICLMDPLFYQRLPAFQELQGPAQREWEIRKAQIEQGTRKGCSSCGKRRSARVRKALEKRHGAIFSQHISTIMKHQGADFSNFKQYVRDNYKKLTGKDTRPDFNKITMYVPVKNVDGVIEVAEVEV